MERKFADEIKVKNVKIGRFSWIKGSLKVKRKAERRSDTLKARRKGKRDLKYKGDLTHHCWL